MRRISEGVSAPVKLTIRAWDRQEARPTNEKVRRALFAFVCPARRKWGEFVNPGLAVRGEGFSFGGRYRRCGRARRGSPPSDRVEDCAVHRRKHAQNCTVEIRQPLYCGRVVDAKESSARLRPFVDAQVPRLSLGVRRRARALCRRSNSEPDDTTLERRGKAKAELHGINGETVVCCPAVETTDRVVAANGDPVR